ncbi:MAG: response regulator [Chloroflexi bacterium]|nr:response regulator [Chloroflexota bacterium]
MYNIFRRQVGAKIILRYLASVSLMVIIGVLVTSRLTQVAETVNDLTNNQAVQLDLSKAMVEQIALSRLYANRYIQHQNQQDLDAFHASFNKLQALLSQVEQNTTRPEDATAIQTLKEDLTAYGTTFEEITNLLAQRTRISAEVLSVQEDAIKFNLATLRVTSNFNSAPGLYLALGNIQNNFLNIRLNVVNYVSTGEDRFAALLDLNYQDIQDNLTEFNRALTTPAQQQISDDIEAALAIYVQGVKAIQNGRTKLKTLEQDQLETLEAEMSRAAFGIANQARQEFQAKNAATNTFVAQTQIILLSAIVSAVVIGLGLGWIISRRITTPLHKVAQTAQQIAKVDVNVKALSAELVSLSQGKPAQAVNLTASPLEIKSLDEVGQLGEAFNQIIFSLQVAGASFGHMSAYLNEMAQAAYSVAQGNLAVSVQARSPEDVLGNALADMAANLRAAEAKLRRHQEHLEELVEERTTALRESERALTTLISNLPGMAYRSHNDQNWTRSFMSEGCFSITGYPSAAFINNAELAYADLMHPDDRQQVWNKVQTAVDARQSFQLTYRITTCTGQEKWMREHGQGVFDPQGKLLALEGFITDITNRIHAEKALQKAKAAAEERSQAAEAANRAKSAFLSTISHELRTPLNGVLGYAQILKRNPTTTPQQEQGLNVIKQSGKHLLTLINDVLDLAKVESGKIELYTVDFHLPVFLAGIAEIIRIRAERKEIEFKLEGLGVRNQELGGGSWEKESPIPTYVHGDERRLRQVLLNLLGNAVKVTDEGSVTLRITNPKSKTCAERRSKSASQSIQNLKFEVIDTGIGLSPQEQQIIFDPFRQVGKQERQAEGTGLGLAISRNLVTLMGGELQVESPPSISPTGEEEKPPLPQGEGGPGSTFWFEIPLPEVQQDIETVADTPQQIIGIQSCRGCTGQTPKVVVVDDNWENRAVLVDLLSPVGFDSVEAVNGQDGLNKVVELQPDVIITDLVMPQMDGFELIRQIRQTSALKDKVVIAASASVFEQDHRKSLEVGGNAFLPKPIVAEALFEQLQRLLKIEWAYRAEVSQETEAAKLILPPTETLEQLLELGSNRRYRGVTKPAGRLREGAAPGIWGQIPAANAAIQA